MMTQTTLYGMHSGTIQPKEQSIIQKSEGEERQRRMDQETRALRDWCRARDIQPVAVVPTHTLRYECLRTNRVCIQDINEMGGAFSSRVSECVDRWAHLATFSLVGCAIVGLASIQVGAEGALILSLAVIAALVRMIRAKTPNPLRKLMLWLCAHRLKEMAVRNRAVWLWPTYHFLDTTCPHVRVPIVLPELGTDVQVRVDQIMRALLKNRPFGGMSVGIAALPEHLGIGWGGFQAPKSVCEEYAPILFIGNDAAVAVLAVLGTLASDELLAPYCNNKVTTL